MPTHTMLLVDDEKEILLMMKRVFQKKFRILEANSGEEAMEHLSREPIDIIIADQRMPMMTGVQLLEQARKIDSLMVRVIISGYTDLEDMIGAINQGEAHRYITKPFEKESLKRTIEELILRYERERQRKILLELDELRRIFQQALKYVQEAQRVKGLVRKVHDSNEYLVEMLERAKQQTSPAEKEATLIELVQLGSDIHRNNTSLMTLLEDVPDVTLMDS